MKFRSEDRSTSLGVWVANVKTQVANGARLAALMAGASGDAVRMLAVLSRRGNLSVEENDVSIEFASVSVLDPGDSIGHLVRARNP